MVRRRKPRRRRNTRKFGAHRRNRSVLPRSAIRNNTSVSVTCPCIREFFIYAAQITQAVTDLTDSTSSIWLDTLRFLGTIALRLFLVTIATAEELTVSGSERIMGTKKYASSAVQSVLFGVEDLVYGSPLLRTEMIDYFDPTSSKTIKVAVPCVDFMQGKIMNLCVTISPGSTVARRAGRVVACLLSFTEDEVRAYEPSTTHPSPLQYDNGWSFSDVVQMPGSVTVPFGTPMTLKWRPSPQFWGYRFLEIGQGSVTGWNFTKNLGGGLPAVRLVIGYQNFSTTTASFSDAYSPTDAMLHVDIRATIKLLEPKHRYIRTYPLTTMDASTAADQANGSFESEIKLQDLRLKDGCLYHIHRKALTLEALQIDE